MAITSLVIALVAICLALRAVCGAHRLLVARRSRLARLIVVIAGLGYGLDSGLRGSRAGIGLLALGLAASASLVRELVRLRSHLPARRRSTRDAGDEGQGACRTRVHHVTELDRSAALHERLRAYLAQLDRATSDGHVGAQAAIAREVATAATELHDVADVVFADRWMLTGATPPPPSGDRSRPTGTVK